MLKCREIVEKASDYLEKDLSLYERFQYRLHLMMCTYCSRFVENFRKGLEMYRASRKSTMSEDKRQELWKRIWQERPSGSGPTESLD